MAKSNPIEDAYAEFSLASNSYASMDKLEAFGQTVWRKVAPLAVDNEAVWDQFDQLLRDATDRISRTMNRPSVEKVWYHCNYLAPTPVVGTVVHCWLPNNKRLFAGHVVQALDAGVVEIALIRGSHDHSITPFHEPVTHVSNPQHDVKQLVKWDYMPGVVPSEDDWNVAKRHIAQREKWHIKALADEAENNKRQDAEQRAAKRQPALTT